MNATPTPHNEAARGQIAPFVIMPGDPVRSAHIAARFLEKAQQVNNVRGAQTYTGLYRGKPVTVTSSGMGMPSMGIYSHELFNFYGVERIVRVGTAGAVAPDIRLQDIIAVQGACTDSNYAAVFDLPGTYAPVASFDLLLGAWKNAAELGMDLRVGSVVTTDAFYSERNRLADWRKMGVLAVEMETAALYMNAARAGKEALSLLSVSDLPASSEELPYEMRVKSLDEMISLALSLA